MILRLLLPAVLILGCMSSCFAASPAELAKSGNYTGAIESYEKAVSAERDPAKKALLCKELGDLFASREDFRNAADQFISALSYSHDFTEEERLRMATRMAWGKRFDSSIVELKLLLKENPENTDVRVQLARTLSWNGNLKEAMRETDRVLKVSPENRDARLVKANVLKWQGKVRDSLNVYRKLLAEEEDFDVRLGYAYAQLAAGDKVGARASVALLKPKYLYEEREVKKIVMELDTVTRPRIEPWYSYYDDTDNNELNRFGVHYGQWLGNWDVGFDFRHTDARDNTRHNWSRDFSTSAYSWINEVFGIGAGVGFSDVGNSGTNTFVTGNVRTDVAVWNGRAGVSFARDVFNDTAQIIENRIRVNSANAYVTQKFADRFSLFGRYSYRDYSDHNNAHDFQIAPACTIYTGNPEISVGYRFRYMNFKRQSGDGYFDPNDFMSHQAFATMSLDINGFSAYLEPYVGVQSFRRDSNDSTDFIGGVTGALGYQFTRHLRLDINGEYGNSAVETAAGFEYFLVGARVGIIF